MINKLKERDILGFRKNKGLKRVSLPMNEERKDEHSIQATSVISHLPLKPSKDNSFESSSRSHYWTF